MKYANGVKATTLTTGTGDVTLAAVSGYVPFPQAFSVGDRVPYAIRNGQNWEWGIGTVQAGGVLERTEVVSTLVAGVFTVVAPARITLTGVSEVVCAITAEDYKALNDSLLAHTTDVANPHGVTAAQAGADEAGTAAGLVAAHEAVLDPHGAYPLEADLGTAAFLDAGTAVGDLVQVQAGGALPALDASALLNLPASGVTDHGALTGLADDDHGHYHTDARGDARYAPVAKGVTNGDSHNHDGGDGAQIAYASLSGLPSLGTAAAAATGDFEASGAVSTHNAASGAHGATATGAAVLTAASQSAGRTALGLGTAATTASTAYEASGAVSAHSGGTGVHTIAGVTGLQGALDAKAPTASPTFTGTVSGITAAMVGAPTGSGTSTGTNTGNETATTLGALLNSATSKTTPVDADRLALWNSVSGLLEYLSWGNLKTALSGLYVLLAGKSGGQTIVGGSAAGESLTLRATSHATQGKVRIDNGALVREVASKEYVQSRQQSLITNGSGLMLDNTNFSTFTYDAIDVKAGAGSFRVNANASARFSDELIPVDVENRYTLSLFAKSGDVGGANYNAANRQYFGISMYDIDGLNIATQNGVRVSGAVDTTLAAALNPGDTAVTLASASGWSNGSYVLQNNFCWYGYTNSFGYTYPDYEYTRLASNNYSGNSSSGAWVSGGISGNVITLRVPWAGPSLPAGTKVRNNFAGGTYQYIAGTNIIVPNAWTKYSGAIGAPQQDYTEASGSFRRGTAYIKLLFLINYHGAADNNLRVSGLNLTQLSSANLEPNIGVGATYKSLPQYSLPTSGLAVEGKAGFGTATPSSQLQAESVTDPFRSGYSATQYFNAVTSSAGVTTFNMVGSAPAAVFAVSDATANAIYDVFTVAKNSSGAGGAGLGARLLWAAKSSTTVSTGQASLASEWVDATHATRKARITISASDYSGAREGFRCESDGTQIKTSVNGVPAAARAAALTAEIPGDVTRDELRLTELYNACKNFGIIN